MVRRDLPFNSLSALQAYLKASPNHVAFSHGGLGSASAIATIKLKAALGAVGVRERVYAGTAAALADLKTGAADILVDDMISALPAIKSGAVKAIGITSTSRNIALPGVYTGAQQGFEDLHASNWHALFAPRGMPAKMRDWLASALDAMLSDPAVARQMRERGMHVPYTEQRGPEALARLQQREMDDVARMFAPSVDLVA
jgi:tripartite-type tricarboxylate transporter receptor subunit TctC